MCRGSQPSGVLGLFHCQALRQTAKEVYCVKIHFSGEEVEANSRALIQILVCICGMSLREKSWQQASVAYYCTGRKDKCRA